MADATLLWIQRLRSDFILWQGKRLAAAATVFFFLLPACAAARRRRRETLHMQHCSSLFLWCSISLSWLAILIPVGHQALP